MYTLGVTPTDVFDPDTIEEHGKLLGLGTRAVNQDGNEYILLEAAAAITLDGLVGFWDEDHVFTPVSTSNDIAGVPVAASRGLPAAAGERFWAQTYGLGNVRGLTSAAANVALNTTGTAGALDDDATSGAFVIEGIHLMTAVGGGGADSVLARISYPHLSGAAIPA